ncbi:MAG: hypothetical protein GF311_28480 [Candidatus Lokiarchaeota archaeon]|nr:hypothetical protein [Candidatus Lokiarchaeota archaeon]
MAVKTIPIPPGQELKILYKEDVQGGYHSAFVGTSKLYLENDITLNFNSSFSALLDASSGPIGEILGQLASVSGMPIAGFKEIGYQKWDNTEPLTLNLTAKVHSEGNARNEVFAPILQLVKHTLPAEGNIKLAQGAIDAIEGALGIEVPGSLGKGLIPPGLNIFQAMQLSGGANAKVARAIQNAVTGVLANAFELGPANRGRVFAIKVGKILIPQLNILKVNPTFNREVDSTHLPLAATVEFEFASVFTPTTNYIQNILSQS